MSEDEKSEKTEETPPASDRGASSDESKRSENSERAGADSAAERSASSRPAATPKTSYTFLVVASAVMLALDLGTKEWAAKRLEGPRAEPIVVIDAVEAFGRQFSLHFDLAKNPGGAWGVLGRQPEWVRLPFFFLISALAVVFIVSLYRKLEPGQRALKWALPLVLGGALGNLVDRIRHQHVIDFIDAFYVQNGELSRWPTFNVADIWIVAGVILMGMDWFAPRRKPKKLESEPAPATGD